MMRITAPARACIFAGTLLMAVFAQDVPESARRVFSRGIIPVNEREEASTPSAPPPEPMPALPAAVVMVEPP